MIDKEWSKDRHQRVYTPTCDVCGATLETVDDFYEAVENMKEAGWVTLMETDEWTNLCPECK